MGPDDRDHARFGNFILATSNSPLRAGLERAPLLDIAAQWEFVGGYDVPSSMQGRSLAAGRDRAIFAERDRELDAARANASRS